MLLPNLIIAGPPKTGTTSLFDWLSKHPDVCASLKKETGFFSDVISNTNKNCNFQQHGIESYDKLFPNFAGEKIIVEATPEYIYTATALSQIPKMQPNPLVLFLYRNPVDRIVSEYKFHRYKTKRFSGSLNEFINQEKIKDKIDPLPFFDKWSSKTENLKILLFDDLKKNPKNLMVALGNVIGIKTNFFENLDFTIKNESLALKNKALHDLSFKISNLIPSQLKDALSPFYFRVNSSKIPSFNTDDLATVSQLRKRFEGNEERLLKGFQKNILSVNYL